MMSTFCGICIAYILSFVFNISENRSQLTSYFPIGRNNYFGATHNLCDINGSSSLNIRLTKIYFGTSHKYGNIASFKIFG